MELSDAIRRRRMIRTYDPRRPVPREIISEMLDLAARAPSAGHSQGWHFLVLDEATARDRFWAVTADTEVPTAWLDRLRTAQALIVCLSDKAAYLERYAAPDKGWTDRDEARWPIPYWHVDTGMAALLVLLCAVDHGLGACFFGVPAARWDALRSAFGMPGRLSPVGVISLGYPAADLRSPSLRRGRRPLSDVVSYGSFAGSVDS
jgi:nitroreductase